MEKNKLAIFFLTLLAVLVSVSLAVLVSASSAVNSRVDRPEEIYPPENLIRLHVVANSDSEEDQALKRKIRDGVVAFMAPQMLAAENIDMAKLITAANLGRIKQIASREVDASGKDYPVLVEMASFDFPTKDYGPFILPAGKYESLRVVVGVGGGANWWCVLFPPLCFVDMTRTVAHPQSDQEKIASASANFSAAEEDSNQEVADDTGETWAVQFRFRILDFIQNII